MLTRAAQLEHSQQGGIRRGFLTFAKIAWALPCSTVGALLGIGVLLAGGSVRRVQRALEFSLAPGTALSSFGRALPFCAITFGHVILGVNESELERLRPHEHVHVRQYERLGVFFFLAYPLASLVAWGGGRCPYRANRYEIEAIGHEIASRCAGRLGG